MSDTPYTDRRTYGFTDEDGIHCEAVHADFARKLERERDQWNDIAERCIEYVYDQDWDPYACDIIKDYESLLKPASNTQQMNTSARYSSSTACDPRCPYCGRPVIGMAVYGSEGAYHPECTHPPKPSVMEELLRRKPEPKYEYPLPKAYQNFCSSNCPQ